MTQSPPRYPDNPFKVPFFVLTGAISVLCLAVGGVAGSALLIVGSLALLLASIWAVVSIRRGRHRRWFAAPLDGMWAQRQRRRQGGRR